LFECSLCITCSMNCTVVQTWIEAACFIQLLALMVNFVLSCINNLNFIIPSMDCDSSFSDVTGCRLNPWVWISDKRGLLAASSMPPNFRVPGKDGRRLMPVIHRPPVPMAIKYYVTTMPGGCFYGLLLRQENFTRHRSRCEAICGSGGLVPPTLYLVSIWTWSAPRSPIVLPPEKEHPLTFEYEVWWALELDFEFWRR